MKKTLFVASALAFVLGSFVVIETAHAAAPEAKCKACHTFGKGEAGKVGPNLFGVVGRKAGSTDFKYGDALKSQAWTWDEAKLKEWVCNSKDAVKKLSGNDGAKTKMPAVNMCGPQADEVVAFLKTLK